MINKLPHSDVNDRIGAGLQEIIDAIIISEETGIFYPMVHSAIEMINRRFSRSIDLPPTQEKILCGATSNVDAVAFLRDSETAQKK